MDAADSGDADAAAEFLEGALEVAAETDARKLEDVAAYCANVCGSANPNTATRACFAEPPPPVSTRVGVSRALDPYQVRRLVEQAMDVAIAGDQDEAIRMLNTLPHETPARKEALKFVEEVSAKAEDWSEEWSEDEEDS